MVAGLRGAAAIRSGGGLRTDVMATVLPASTAGEVQAPRPVDRAAWGLVLGPVAFIAAWVTAGALMPAGSSPIEDAISRTAAVGAPTRWLMSAGFVAYAIGTGMGAAALRRHVPGPAWVALGVNAVATLGVALTPLDRSPTVDSAHAVAAALGYASLALVPLLAVRPLAAAGQRHRALASAAVGAVVAGCLMATVAADGTSGLLQRAGLTVGDLWLITAGVALLRGAPLTGHPLDLTEETVTGGATLG